MVQMFREGGQVPEAGAGRLGVVLAAAIAIAVAMATATARAADAPVAGTLDLTRVAAPGLAAAGADALFEGARAHGHAGASVAFAGDMNGDGRQDYAVGVPLASEVDVIYGAGSPETLTLSQPGIRGFRIRGPSLAARVGTSVAAAGDVNGDGFDDIAVGAPGASLAGRPDSGGAYVVFGGEQEPPVVSLRSLGTRGIVVSGAGSGDRAGTSLAAIGDLDGDGRPEMAIGAPDGSAAFVVYSTALETNVDLGALGVRGYQIGGAPGERAGAAVAGVGDMNGDGLPEAVVGAPLADGGNGAAFVVWGKSPAAAVPVDLAALGAQGFVMSGTGGEQAGTAVAGLADATGDGRPDVAVGAPLASDNGRASSGAAYIVPGRAETAPAGLSGTGLRIEGSDVADRLGSTLAAAGDVDEDGTADVLIGSARAKTLARGRSGNAILLLTGRAAGSDVDTAVLGYGGVRLAGPAPGATSGPALAGGVDVDGDGRADVLFGNGLAASRRGEAALVLLPPPPGHPATPPVVAPARATNVEAIVDDSASMAKYDPGGVLRRQALELILVNPANQDRVFGAVEMGTFGHQILPPLRIGDAALEDGRLDVLRELLAERIANDGGHTNFAAGLLAAAAGNPAAQARILMTDGGQLDGLTGFGGVPTYVIGLHVDAAGTRERLGQLARDSDAEFYPVHDAGELQAALAAIDARLRGEPMLDTIVADTPDVSRVAAPQGEAAAAVSHADAAVSFTTVARTPAARALRSARMIVSWDRRDSRFRLTRLRFRVAEGVSVRVPRPKLRRALRGHWQRLRRGLRIKARIGRTFIALDVRGIDHARRGRRANASALGFGAVSFFHRSGGKYRTVVRSAWTYQHRPT